MWNDNVFQDEWNNWRYGGTDGHRMLCDCCNEEINGYYYRFDLDVICPDCVMYYVNENYLQSQEE